MPDTTGKPKKPRITLVSDQHIKSLLASIRTQGTSEEQATDHAVLRAALRVGLAAFASSTETCGLALQREHHRFHLNADDFKPATLKSVNRVLEFTRRAS
jgi:hypothetical protein